jgi:hypothetical protein
MCDDARSSAQGAKSTGITRLVTQNGPVILVVWDWDLLAYRRSPGTQPRPLPRDETRIIFTRIGSIEIGQRADVERVNRIAARYVKSAVVSIDEIVPPPGLSATELETVRFVGNRINGHLPHRWAEQ